MLVLSVVPPTVTRVTEVAPVAVVPRLFTATVKVTAAPTAGFGGLEAMLSDLQVRAGSLRDHQRRRAR